MDLKLFVPLAFALLGYAYDRDGTGTASSQAQCTGNAPCTVSGALTMSNDGHGYIGRLERPDGTCVNVSLPDNRSKEMQGNPPVQTTVTGRFLPYVISADEFVLVNGRRIGVGRCGDEYLFVK